MADAGTTSRRRGTGGNIVIFPEKMHSILDRIEGDGLASIISWLPHGKAFKIHNDEEFASLILPKYFWLLKASFQRQLNIYGFKRVKTGPDRGAIYHELFLRNKPELCKGMTRRINVKEKRLAEERAKRENPGKKVPQPEEGKSNDPVPKPEREQPPPRQAPPSHVQPDNRRPPIGQASYVSRGQNPPDAPATNPHHSLPVPVPRPPAVPRPLVGPDRQPVYTRQPPPRVPGDPSRLRSTAVHRPVEPIDTRAISGDILQRDWDLRRRIYESELLRGRGEVLRGREEMLHSRGELFHGRGELIRGRGELLHGRGAALAGYPPEYYVRDPRDSGGALLAPHREGDALYQLESHPPHRLASLQDRYELDRDILQDELVYGPRAPLPVSAPPYPRVGLPPRAEEVHVPAGVANDRRIARQAMMGRAIPAGSGHYPGEAASVHDARPVRAAAPPAFPSERRRVDDAMLLLLLNENSTH